MWAAMRCRRFWTEVDRSMSQGHPHPIALRTPFEPGCVLLERGGVHHVVSPCSGRWFYGERTKCYADAPSKGMTDARSLQSSNFFGCVSPLRSGRQGNGTPTEDDGVRGIQ